MLENYNQQEAALPSEPVVYVDPTLVAHAVAREFHDAAAGHPRDKKVEFFGNEGSLNRLVRAVTRRIANQPTIQISKKPEIRKEVKRFLQVLEKNKILENPKKGRYSGKWVFDPARMDAVEVVSGSDVSDFASDGSTPKSSRRRSGSNQGHGRRRKRKGGVPPYRNSSGLCRPPVAHQPSAGLV